MYFEYRIVKIEKGLFFIEYKTAPYGVWHEVDKKFKTKPKAEGLERTQFNEVKRMNGLLSMIGMQTELEYQMGDDFPFGSPRIRFNVPKGNIPSDKQKCQPKEQHEFTIKGVKIMAASKKDAIKKFNHRKK